MKSNIDNEKFFLSLVDKKLLGIDESGNAFNVKTRRFIGNFSKNGYKSIGWKVDGKVKHQLIHRLVHILYNDGFTEEQPLCNHKDGNKSNNHFSNLERCSGSENIIHAFNKGLKTISEETKEKLRKIRAGENGTNSKITNEEAIEIRDKYKTGLYTYRSLGKEYGIAHNTISDIINRKTYNRV